MARGDGQDTDALIRCTQNDALTLFKAHRGNVSERRLDRPPRRGMGEQSNLVILGIAPRPYRCGTSHSHAIPLQDGCDRPDVAWTANREAKIVPAVAIASLGPNAAAATHGKPAFVASDVDDIRKHSARAR